MMPLFRMSYDESDLHAVAKVLERGSQWACGIEIDVFEKKLADYMGRKYCVVTNSGTSALHAIMYAYGIGKGDEVIVPSFTFAATANAPCFTDAKPVFADIDSHTMGISPNDVKKRINNNTKAIMPIHYGGCPCHIEELRKLADKHDILLIEDCAEAMGSMVKGRKVGTFGDSAVLSFCQNKIISSGEGGAVVTDNDMIYDRLKLIVSHGRECGDYFGLEENLKYTRLGYNWRMASMNAALGISQLSRIERFIEMRRNIAHLYASLLGDLKEIILPEFSGNVFQLFTIRARKRDRLMRYLRKKGVSCKVYFQPVHKNAFYNKKEKLPITEKVAGDALSIPIYPGMTIRDVSFVAKSIRRFYGR